MLTDKQYREIEAELIQHGFDGEGKSSLEVRFVLDLIKKYVEVEDGSEMESR